MTQQGTARIGDRARRGFWFDPRFAIGIGLVVLSVAGVITLVGTADSSVEVMAAREDLAPGQRVSAADLQVTRARVSDADSLYLSRSEVPAAGLVVTRPVSRGELLPQSAVGSADGLELTSVVVSTTSQLPESVGSGSRIDVWSAAQEQTGTFAAPTVIVSSATVVRLVQQDGLVVDSAGPSVELLVPRSAVARVLEAVANGAAISVVPVDLPVKG
ncbi:SAF domain-containing protein [Glaciihabitans sp. dw_435]|uniref:SAF domain-containing protein n=1 Tax=Glaciihabitans sp. dw_435 TaxID=2720081 RepID=UPI001BD67A3B|nr:SAF domain-containing protein [Glaciihabitans sp. dw_435]